jgi:hypothetical protein
VTATAAGERVGFETRDPRLVEPCAESFTRRRRAKEDRYGGFEQHVESCQAGGDLNLHWGSMAEMAAGGNAVAPCAVGLPGRRANSLTAFASREPELAGRPCNPRGGQAGFHSKGNWTRPVARP